MQSDTKAAKSQTGGLSPISLRDVLPACQPQEGSPPNTFTVGELQELQAGLSHVSLTPAPHLEPKFDIRSWDVPDSEKGQLARHSSCVDQPTAVGNRDLGWYGAPKFEPGSAATLRQLCRSGKFSGPTNALCPGFLQCNLVIVPREYAFDFLLFCQRNPQACPLIEVCDAGSPHPVGVAVDADLRTDLPKYTIYRDGLLDCEVTDITSYWREDLVSFLIGCSFSYDGELSRAGIPLRSAEQGRNVPMYLTNLACRPAGPFSGRMVVSMKPIPALSICKHVEITSKYKHAHGGPLCVGRPDVLGIPDIRKPDWGEAVEMQPDDVAVFHACGVTPQAVLKESNIPFAITHSPGHMFVTDLPSDLGA